MASMSKTQLIGNLGADPDVRYMPDGTAVAALSVATTDTWKDKNGDKQEHTEWHRVVYYGRLAEICKDHLKKGSQIYVEGANRTRKWEDKEGATRYTTEIRAKVLKMLGSKRSGVDDAPAMDAPPPSAGDDLPADLDDSIPF